MAEFGKTTKVASQNKRNASIVKYLGACIFVCLMFCAGFLLRGNATFLDMVGLSSFEVEADANPGLTVTGNTYDSISARVAEVEGLLGQDSIDSYDLGQTTTKVLNAFVESTDDTYLRYYDEQSYQAYLASTTNPSAGVGVLFNEVNGEVVAVDVFEGSSAAASGVQAGDVVSSIDGISMKQWSLPEALEALSRDDGSEVYIMWQRPATSTGEEATTFGTTLSYSNSTEDNVTYSVSDGVGVISLKQVASDSAANVKSAVEACVAQGAQAFVLDLRDVPGGYLTQAVGIASLFISSGDVVKIETVDGVTARSVDGQIATDAPLTVLVNSRTSGCAEVLAAALQETERAELVGTTTQGKGSIQVMQPLSFGGALRYTAAYYLTAQGGTIEGKGITPNVEIASAESQESVAFDLVRSQIVE